MSAYKPQHVGAPTYFSGEVKMMTGCLPRWQKLLFEPFISREQARYASPGNDPSTGEPIPGSLWLGVRKSAISAILEASFTFLLVVTTVGTAAGAFAATSNGVLRALIIGAVHALGRWAGISARHVPHLPRAGDPGLVWFWWWRGEIGAVILALVYGIPQFGGASLGILALCIPGLFASDMWSGMGKFGSGAALSTFGAYSHYVAASTILYFVMGFAQTFTSKRYSYDRRFIHGATMQAATVFVLTQYLYHMGIFSCGNSLIYYAGAVGGGTQYLPTGDALSWVIPIILAPLTAGPIAAFFVWIFWSQGGMSKLQRARGYNKDLLEEEAIREYGQGDDKVTVPGDFPGATARTPEGQREIGASVADTALGSLLWPADHKKDE